MKIIGLTGGVGSGKSQVLSYLEEQYNAYICQADHVAWELQMPGEDCYQQILRVFGSDILNAEHLIDRKKLGNIVFSDAQQLLRLNAIMHLAVKERIYDLIEQQRILGTELFVLEAALLLEEHYDEICDEVWYIYTSEPVRRERLRSSRGYSNARMDQIISTQMAETIFRKKCDRIIDNSGLFEDTCGQIKEIM